MIKFTSEGLFSIIKFIPYFAIMDDKPARHPEITLYLASNSF